MQPDLQHGFRLHDRTVLPEQNRITGGGEDAHVTPRTMAVLVCLAEHAGDVVTREFMDEHVWRSSVVTDHALTSCISELRNHLGDACGESRFIETVPKRGYRLIAPATPLEDPAEPEARSPSRRLPRIALPLGLAAVVVVIAGVWLAMHTGSSAIVAMAAPPPAATPDEGSPSASVASAPVLVENPIPSKSIAVLPFENLSADKNNAYFADGMQDLILTKLADIGDLRVISRISTEQYKSHPDDLKAIARQLGVATILEGSVQKAGDQVLINVQLIDAKTNSHIWAHSYTRTLDNIFGVEGDVAGRVAAELNAKITASETAAVARVPTTNPQAYNDYLRALHFDNEATKGDWTTFVPLAITASEKAVTEDPGFALAWAELSSARSGALYWGVDRSEANLRAAEVAAKRALALAPKLAEAHLAMASIERHVYHDMVATHDQNQQAVDLRPNDSHALTDLGISDANLGNPDAAIKAFRRAVAVDPMESFTEYELGLSLAAVGDYAAARQAERRALAIDPQNVQAYLALSRIDIAKNGDVDAATKVLDHMVPGTPVNAQVVTMRINLLLYQRQFATARALAEKYSDKFTTEPAAIDMTLARANIEWLADNTDHARALYRAAIGLMTQSGTVSDHVKLGLAYARLGEGDAAMKANAAAAAMFRRSHYAYALKASKYDLAKSQLASGRKSAAIDTLAQLVAPETHGTRIVTRYPPELLRIDPVWDPIRKDPRFQSLLNQYARYKPVVTYDSALESAALSASPSVT